MKSPTEIERNQVPIMSPPIRAGASLVIALMPTGLRHNSPTVCSRYVSVSHQGLAFVLFATGIRIAKPRPTKTSPQENFAVLDGSLRASLTQSQAKTGASAMIKTELNA